MPQQQVMLLIRDKVLEAGRLQVRYYCIYIYFYATYYYATLCNITFIYLF